MFVLRCTCFCRCASASASLSCSSLRFAACSSCTQRKMEMVRCKCQMLAKREKHIYNVNALPTVNACTGNNKKEQKKINIAE